MLLFAGSKIFKKDTPPQPEYSIKLQLEKDTLEYGKTIEFKVEGIYRHYILKYNPKMIKVNVKTSQISLKSDKNVAGKRIERAMLKVTCKEDTSKYDIKYVYLKKRKTSFKDILGRGKSDIKQKMVIEDKSILVGNPSGGNSESASARKVDVTASGGKRQPQVQTTGSTGVIN